MDASMCTNLLGAAPVAVVSLLGFLAVMQSSRGTQGVAAAPDRQQYSLGLQHIPLQEAAPFLLFALLLALECLMRVGVHRQVRTPTDACSSSCQFSRAACAFALSAGGRAPCGAKCCVSNSAGGTATQPAQSDGNLLG